MIPIRLDKTNMILLLLAAGAVGLALIFPAALDVAAPLGFGILVFIAARTIYLDVRQNQRRRKPVDKAALADKLQQAIGLIKSGDKEAGRKLLVEVIEADPNQETAWLWLASAVPPEQRLACLEKAVSLNPGNLQARQVVEQLKASQPARSRPRIKPRSNLDARLSGFFFLILGAGLGYWQIVLPIAQALRSEPRLGYFTEAVPLSVIAVLLGLFLLVFGADGLQLLTVRPSKKVLAFILVGTLVVTFGSIFGMEAILKSLGYR